MDRIVLFGAGANCTAFLREADLSELEVVGIVDSKKAGQQSNGYLVSDPSILEKKEYDKVFVTPENYLPIKDMLMDKYDLKEEQIICPSEMNSRYILPRISELDNVFLFENSRYEDCFPYAFSKMVQKGLMTNIRLLSGKGKHFLEAENDKPKLIIIMSDDLLTFRENGTLDCLKEAFPNIKWFLWLCNPCEDETYKIPEIMRIYGGAEGLKKQFDYCYTYHETDAKKYGFIYYPQFYPYMVEDGDTVKKNKYDVFFIGNAKNRFPLILSVFNKLRANGLKCKFIISRLPKEERVYEEGLEYIENGISYEKSLEYLKESKCIMEICNDLNETSYRYAEALNWKKKLLINDLSIKKKPHYSETNMQIFKTADDIDIDWLRQDAVEYGYKGEFDIEHYLKDVLNCLC